MRRKYRKIQWLALLSATILISACAGTARGLKTSSLSYDGDLSVADTSRSRADAMVVIRYPAIVDELAIQKYYESFSAHVIGGEYDLQDAQNTDTDRIAQGLIAKSNYFAMSLYRELSENLPAHSVLLSPHLVVDGDEGLSSRPLLAAEEIPSVVTIDFSVYSFPDPTRMMDSEPLTFGDIVTPLFVIHANRWLRAPTHGLLLSSSPLLDVSWAQSETQADGQVNRVLDHSLKRVERPLDFISFLNGSRDYVRDVPLKSVGESRREVLAVENYPIEKIRMDGEVVAGLPIDHSVDPFAEDFVRGAAGRIVTALNRVDHDRATFFDRQRALAAFDPELADAFLARSRNESVRARLAMAETLLAAERKFMSTQSVNLFDGVYEGTYGDQMRQMIAAEYRLLEERRDLARRQNIATAIAILAAAGAIYAGSDAGDSSIFHSSTMANVMILGSVWAVNSAVTANAESRTIGQNFLAQMAPAINRQVSIQIEWLESTRAISARDFEEFRTQTMALYQESIRSIGHDTERQCRFSHPSLDSPGRWLGGCFAGLASGSGYGVVADGKGTTVEYVGSAEDGKAAGTGAMIFRTAGDTGAVYYEGGFRDGWPDGVVLVEKPGRKPAVRKFHAGFDKGQADAEQLQRLRF